MDATNKEMCKKVWDLVYSDADRRIQVEEIVQALGISQLFKWKIGKYFC